MNLIGVVSYLNDGSSLRVSTRSITTPIATRALTRASTALGLWVPGKHEALVALVSDLVHGGVPINGVGLQTHRLPGAVLDTERFASQMRDFTALGLEVAVTETLQLTKASKPTLPATGSSTALLAAAGLLLVSGGLLVSRAASFGNQRRMQNTE